MPYQIHCVFVLSMLEVWGSPFGCEFLCMLPFRQCRGNQLQIIAVDEEFYGKMLMNGLARQKDWKHWGNTWCNS